MKNITTTVSRYVSAWNEKTTATVRAALEQCCAAEISYTDKQTPLLKGIDALALLIMDSYEKVPGRTISVLTAPEYFDHHCYYSWGIHIPGSGVLAGRDYLQYNEDGLITQIVGFLPVAP
jgi:hypothetical protein